MPEITLTPIGRVRSSVTVRKDMPPLGVAAAVEVYEAFAQGLLHIEKHSHIWVLAWLDETGRDALQVTPRGVNASRGQEALHGVFAVRSPTRPNPIGLTAARITARRGNTLDLDSLDFIDGTAVIDIKPYYVTRDMIFSASNQQVGRPSTREALHQALLMQGAAFSGELTPQLQRAAEILADFRGEVLAFSDPRSLRITAPLHFAEAFMALARVRWSDGSLRIHDLPVVLLEEADHRREYPV